MEKITTRYVKQKSPFLGFEFSHFTSKRGNKDQIYKIKFEYICRCPVLWTSVKLKTQAELRAFCNEHSKVFGINSFGSSCTQSAIEIDFETMRIKYIVSVNTNTTVPEKDIKALNKKCFMFIWQELVPAVKNKFFTSKNNENERIH